jgi:hypothetical protein
VKKKDTMLMRGLLQLGSRASLFTGKKDAYKTAKETGKAGTAVVKFLFFNVKWKYQQYFQGDQSK